MKKTIGVFDTGCMEKDNMPYLKFAEDILKLLNDYLNIEIIFKTKKRLIDTPSLCHIYSKLMKHTRCDFRERYTVGASAPEVIAISDMVIGIIFTSAVGEAWCANVKGVFYDPTGMTTGRSFYFNQFPNLVAHGYDELAYLVDFWLNNDFETLKALREAGERHTDLAGADYSVTARASQHSLGVKEKHYKKTGWEEIHNQIKKFHPAFTGEI